MGRKLACWAVCGVLLLPSVVHATGRQVQTSIFSATAVASTGSATSSAQKLGSEDGALALAIVATSASGTADVKVEFALSLDGTTYGSFDDSADITSSTAGDCATPEGLCVIALPPRVLFAPFVKFKVTGVGTNPADTVVTASVITWEIR